MLRFTYCFTFLIFNSIYLYGFQKEGVFHNNSKPKGIWAIEWSADGSLIALGGDDSTVWIYNSSDYKLLKGFRLSSMVRGLSWHPKKNLLAIATLNSVDILDPISGKAKAFTHLRTGGRAIGWNHNGKYLALADNNGEIQLMNADGTIVRTIAKHNKNSFLTLDWHPNKDIMITGSDEIIMFDINGKQLALIYHRDEPTGVLSVKWHPSGKYFASGDYGHKDEGKPTLLQFWKEDGTAMKTINGHQAEIRNLRWSRDGKKIATASDSLRVWSQDGQLLHSGSSKTNIWSLAWSKDCKTIITGCFENGFVQLWDENARLLKDIN